MSWFSIQTAFDFRLMNRHAQTMFTPTNTFTLMGSNVVAISCLVLNSTTGNKHAVFVLPLAKTRRAKRQLPWHFTEINHNFTNKLTEQLCKYQVHGCLMELLFYMLCKKSSQFIVCFSTFKSSCCVHLKFRLCRAAFFYDYDYFRK